MAIGDFEKAIEAREQAERDYYQAWEAVILEAALELKKTAEIRDLAEMDWVMAVVAVKREAKRVVAVANLNTAKVIEAIEVIAEGGMFNDLRNQRPRQGILRIGGQLISGLRTRLPVLLRGGRRP